MSNLQRPSLFGRMRNWAQGLFGRWITNRENASPEVIYEQAIEGRVQQYRDLKSAVAGILYMRNKLEAEISERRAEIARLHDDIRRAVRGGRDEISLTLIANKQALFEELERAESELEACRGEADEAKHNLVRFREEIRTLVREKGQMLATLANARARKRLQQAVEGMSVDAEMAALESVREHIGQMASESQVDRELGGDDDVVDRRRLRAFRNEARVEAARAELDDLKREMGQALPMEIEHTRVPEPATAPVPAATG